MSDAESTSAPVLPAATETKAVGPAESTPEAPETSDANGTSNGDAVTNTNEESAEITKDEKLDKDKLVESTTEKQDASEAEDEVPASTKDIASRPADSALTADSDATTEPVDTVQGTPNTTKSKGGRRKSVGVPEHKNKKLSKKASIAKITHLDAKPGDFYLARLKGYPPWPCIICTQDMLPALLLKGRPVTAAREDGTYLPGYEDGGPKAKDRTYPIMYLATNEFGWQPNTELIDLDFDTLGDIQSIKKKDLREAHVIAVEKHELSYFKQMLVDHEESRQAEIAEKEAKKAEKAEKAQKTKRKSKLVTEVVEDNEDTEMPDAAVEEDGEATKPSAKKKKTNKRKADVELEDVTAPDSNKKPKVSIKLTQKANGTEAATPKATKEKETPATKTPKPKAKKLVKAKETPQKTELTPEEKYEKKEKEILFLRHKLQKGLLTKDSELKEDEMKGLADFITKLEGYVDLEVSIIRQTKIYKVLKAILKLPSIPKEEEFRFKPRSQTLLDKWNKLFASDDANNAKPSTGTNGVKTESKKIADSKSTPAKNTNGAKSSQDEVTLTENEAIETHPAANGEKVGVEEQEALDEDTDLKADAPETEADVPSSAASETKEEPKVEEAPSTEGATKTSDEPASTESSA